jgi:hypothetical protein
MYRLEEYEKELRSTKRGREILGFIMQHVTEMTRLINHNREVMLTWQRNKGAVFFSQFMGSGFDSGITMKKEMDGVYLSSLIRRMAVVLQDYGSSELRKAIDQYFLLILTHAENYESLQQIFKKIRQYE